MFASANQTRYSQHLKQQQQYPIHDHKQRLLAGSIACLITIFLALQFNHRLANHVVDNAQNSSLTLLNLELIKASARQVSPQETATKKIEGGMIIPMRSQTIVSRSNVTIAAQTELPSDPPQVIQTIQTSQTPLLINRNAISKAYNDSKSDIQKMAEASGKELNSPVKTQYEKFQTAAQEAAIPDCLSPQGPGGLGLLAIPVIAFSAATGKCK